MKAVVFKYTLGADNCTFLLPVGSKPLSVGEQNDAIVMWVLQPIGIIDMREWIVSSVNTGSSFDFPIEHFLGTVSIDGFSGSKVVWHIFARRTAS
jgi:hypothetical protein